MSSPLFASSSSEATGTPSRRASWSLCFSAPSRDSIVRFSPRSAPIWRLTLKAYFSLKNTHCEKLYDAALSEERSILALHFRGARLVGEIRPRETPMLLFSSNLNVSKNKVSTWFSSPTRISSWPAPASRCTPCPQGKAWNHSDRVPDAQHPPGWRGSSPAACQPSNSPEDTAERLSRKETH